MKERKESLKLFVICFEIWYKWGKQFEKQFLKFIQFYLSPNIQRAILEKPIKQGKWNTTWEPLTVLPSWKIYITFKDVLTHPVKLFQAQSTFYFVLFTPLCLWILLREIIHFNWEIFRMICFSIFTSTCLPNNDASSRRGACLNNEVHNLLSLRIMCFYLSVWMNYSVF